MNAKRFRCPNHWTLRQRLDFGTGSEDPKTGCWPWVRQLADNGYGKVNAPGGVKLYAHRVALAFKLGRSLEKGEECRHMCDNRPCVNPEHLEPGTRQDNMDDKADRGRSKGANHKADVIQTVFDMRSAGAKHREIAEAVGVSGCTVGTWLREAGMRTNRHTAVTSDIVEKRQLCHDLWDAGGLTKAEIAREIGASSISVSRWLRGEIKKL